MYFFLKIFFIYQREHKQGERKAEAGTLLNKELDVGLDPRTLW